MSITRSAPNTIYLGGPRTIVNDMSAKAAITPGHLVERVNTSGVWQWQKHATAGGNVGRSVATEQSMNNLGVDDDYAADDLVEVSLGAKGSTFWMLIASGQNISYGDSLESAGNGTLRILSSGTPLFTALETTGAVTELTRVRVETE